jgi:hypothetical protein
LNAVENENAFADYKAETEALKGEKDKNTWEQKMLASKEKAKERAIHAIDVAYDGAAEIISELPKGSQDVAYNVFDMGQEFVGQVFDTLVAEMQAMLNKIVDFIKGIWASMVDAWNTVVSAVTNAINWIRGIFLTGPNDPAPATREPGTAGPDPNKADGLDGGKVAVSFKLQWLSRPALQQNEVDASVLYLDDQITRGLGDRYLVQFGDSYQVSGGWEVEGIVPDVEEVDVIMVIQTIKGIVNTEDRRNRPLGNPWTNVPTPDPVMYFNSFEILEPTTQQPSLAALAHQKKTGTQLPTVMRTRQALVANGH